MRSLILAAAALAAAPLAAQPARVATQPAAAAAAAQTAALIDQALAGAHRSDAARARDRYRNPRETLLFFGLEPGMTVVEVSPGAGWYTDIIAPVLNGRGRFIAAHNNPAGSEGQQKQRAAFIEWVNAHAAVLGPVTVTAFGRGIAGQLAEPGSADLVLSFRNVHNWAMAGFADEAFKAFYDALKPGGVLGVVEHRMPENFPDTEQTQRSGYMKESEVIRLAEAAGFRLDARSEINANPRDTADHPKGVWTLPPNLALGDTDRDKYLAIGESDRMTLRFVKPAR